jgi:hypothetical protein
MVSAKANKLLSYIKRSSLDIRNEKTHLSLYKTMVRSLLAYCTQVYSPQSVFLILQIENVQRRATRYILSLPFMSGISYKERLIKTGLLPLSYWNEYLDIVYLYKMLVSSQDRNIQIKTTCRVDKTKKLRCPQNKTIIFIFYHANLQGQGSY